MIVKTGVRFTELLNRILHLVDQDTLLQVDIRDATLIMRSGIWSISHKSSHVDNHAVFKHPVHGATAWDLNPNLIDYVVQGISKEQKGHRWVITILVFNTLKRRGDRG